MSFESIKSTTILKSACVRTLILSIKNLTVHEIFRLHHRLLIFHSHIIIVVINLVSHDENVLCAMELIYVTWKLGTSIQHQDEWMDERTQRHVNE